MRVSLRRVILVAGPAIAVAAGLAVSDSISPAAGWTAAVTSLCALWWIFEPIPIPATSLIPLAVFPLIVIVVLGALVPTPAAIGSYHKAVQIGLATLLGVPNDVAVGYAIVSHAVAYLPSGSIGLFLLAREGVSMDWVRRSRELSA